MSEINTDHLKIVRNPNKNFHYCIGPSKIHGIGIFASKDIFIGEKISVFLWLKSKKPRSFIRDECCRFCNHSDIPNAKIVKDQDNFSLYCNKDLKKGQEIFVSYPDSMKEMVREGYFSMPNIVRCRTGKYIPFAMDKKGRSFMDELDEIRQRKWK